MNKVHVKATEKGRDFKRRVYFRGFFSSCIKQATDVLVCSIHVLSALGKKKKNFSFQFLREELKTKNPGSKNLDGRNYHEALGCIQPKSIKDRRIAFP